ncbi:oligosaccharide flippase family protein [uncultured Tateyamaria sp.]|uniref:oligosaccharide flippase family protein n=1 Tax=uncultured Tateyamaria sp. TaxID=455651 RepID=UPI00261E6766|nr:oligosaccharide flippase family protein [uncultured Tateyamaria sp.]
MIRNSAFIFGGNMVSSLFLLARNVFLARLLTVENYGIAMTFAIVVAAMELATNMASDRMLIQAKDGDDAKLQDTMHGFEIIRGAVLAFLLFLCAAPLAKFFQAPQAVNAFQVLALVPMLRGFRHLDMFRVQRKKDFKSFVLVPLISQGGAMLAIFPLAMIFPDYRAMVASIMLQHGLFVLLSHYLAQRRYGLGLDIATARRVMAFGLPLMTNGLLMFMILNGDRLIIANQFGPIELGWFSAAFTIALTPTLIVGKTIQTVFLPTLSRRFQQQRGLELGAIAAVQAGIAAGVGFAVILATIGPFLFRALFGAAFDQALPLLVLLGLMQGLRIAKAGPVTISIATAHTSDPLYANLVRISAIPVGLIIVLMGGSATHLVIVAILGEIASLIMSLSLVNKRIGLAWRTWIPLLAFTSVIGGMIVLTARSVDPSFGSIFETERMVLLVIFGTGFFLIGELWGMAMKKVAVRDDAVQ